jgi:outer membrane lipoprotein-sorting protein
MKSICICLLTIVSAALPFSSHAQVGETDRIDQILTQIEEINRFGDMYTNTTNIASFSPNADPLLTSFRTFSKGIDNILIYYKSPKKDTGKKILFRGDKIWMYFPKAKKAIVMNPVNTLFGTVAIGDILGPPILDLYELERVEYLGDGSDEIYDFYFTAKTNTSPYGSVMYRFEGDHIVYSECYTRSGILLKRAFFSEFRKNEKGFSYATRIKMESTVNPKYYSLIQITGLEMLESIPDYYFQPEGLSLIEIR